MLILGYLGGLLNVVMTFLVIPAVVMTFLVIPACIKYPREK